MDAEELNCPVCSHQYTQENPPRLLTMCGHTFCHKCIKTLITKKNSRLFKVKCPLDKTIAEIEKPQPTLFPKNMVLLNFLAKKKEEILSQEEANEFLDIELPLSNHLQNSSDVAVNQLSHISFEESAKVCEIHKKPLQIFCIDEGLQICTDCAIFGEHKSHKLTNVKAMGEQTKKLKADIQQMVGQKKEIEDRISDRQMENSVLDLLQERTQSIKSEIKKKFEEVRSQLDTLEAQAQEKLEEKSLQVAESIEQKLSIDQKLQKQYLIWKKETESFLEREIQEQKKSMIFDEQKILKVKEQGNAIIQKIKVYEDGLLNVIEEEIRGLQLVSNCNSILKQMPDMLKIQTSPITDPIKLPKVSKKIELSAKQRKAHGQIKEKQSFVQKNQKRQTSGKENKAKPDPNLITKQSFEEESLLQDESTFDQSRSFILNSSKSCNNLLSTSRLSAGNPRKSHNSKSFVKKSPTGLIDGSTQKTERSSSINGNLASSRSSHRVQSKVNQRSSRNIQKNISQKKIKGDLTEKQLQILDGLKNDKLDVLDLTGMELDDEKVQLFIQSLQNTESVKSVKLLRNKLTDECLETILRACKDSVERLNLAQNKFTEQSLTTIQTFLQQHSYCKLKYIHLGQNRIIERKNKDLIQDLKTKNVSLVL